MIIYFLTFLALLYEFPLRCSVSVKLKNFQQDLFLVSLVFAVEAAVVQFLLPDPYSFMLRNG